MQKARWISAGALLLATQALAGPITLLTQTRSVESTVTYLDGGSPVEISEMFSAADFGPFLATAGAAHLGYSSSASQDSTLSDTAISIASSASVLKPFEGTLDVLQSATSIFHVSFEVSSAVNFELGGVFNWGVDTGGDDGPAFGSLDISLVGPSGTIFELTHAYPTPDRAGSIPFSVSSPPRSLLAPGVYTLSASTSIALETIAGTFTDGGFSSATIDLVVPEPSSLVLLVTALVFIWRKR